MTFNKQVRAAVALANEMCAVLAHERQPCYPLHSGD